MGDKAVTFVNGKMKKAGDTGTVDFDGNVNLGNADSDNIVFKGEVDSNIIPDDDKTYTLGTASKTWSQGHFYDINAYNSLVVSSTVSNAELIRLQKGDTDTRYFVFESDGVDKFEMYLNSFENFTFTTTDTTDDILFRLNGHTAIYMDGYPKEVRIWDTYNSSYNTQINSTLLIAGEVSTERSISRKSNLLSNASGTVTHDTSVASVFFHETLGGDFTADFTNVSLSSGYITNFTLILEQGASARMCTGVKINGTGQTIMWEGGSTPAGTSNGFDKIDFNILYDGSNYLVLAKAESY